MIKKFLLISLILLSVLAFSCQVGAYSLTVNGGVTSLIAYDTGVDLQNWKVGLAENGYDFSQNQVMPGTATWANYAIDWYTSGTLSSGFKLTWNGNGDMLSGADLFIKDGNGGDDHSPYWYLFDLGNDDINTLTATNFWTGDAISHISFHDGNTPVPEPATMILFGLGLLGLAGVSRRKK